jgi:hypothetical protein
LKEKQITNAMSDVVFLKSHQVSNAKLDVLQLLHYNPIKGIKMRIYDKIEICWLEKNNITDAEIYEVLQSISDQELCNASGVFLRGIDTRHQVPGKVVHTFSGMCEWYREHEEYTNRQRVWIIRNLIDHWDQIGLQTRSAMNL